VEDGEYDVLRGGSKIFNCRTTVFGAIELFDFLADRLEVDNFVDFAQQVNLVNQFFNADEFHADWFVIVIS
jgi:hypothetical protein